MRKSLSLKMLIMTFGSFILLISGIIACLYLYFGRFYEPLKIDHTIQAINEFTSSYERNNWDNDQLYAEVFQFMKAHNVTMGIGPRTNQAFSVASFNSGFRKSSIPYFLINKGDLFQNKLVQADIFKPTNLWGFSAIDIKVKGSNPAGYTTSMSADINDKVVLFSQAPLQVPITSGMNKSYEKDGISYSISIIPYTNYREVNFIKKSRLNGRDVITNVTLSLQSVDEVTDFLLGIFPYLIAAAVLLSIIMVFVYSRTISKPIVSLTKTANRMANMELGITSKLKRKDELGVLSDSLNTLSGNLKKALDEVSEANVQLKEDYENELKQEKIRKEFVANVSHELKTPLGVIKSYTEGIRDGVKKEKRAHYMEVILDEITRMDSMIREMLEISRFDAGAVKYSKKEVSVDTLLEKAVNYFDAKAAEKAVVFKITGEYGNCLLDEEKIRRVVFNLIDNAVKYCNSNSIIAIKGERSDNTLTISIENDCNVIGEEVLDKIWDRFYKADASHNRDIEGTGLGLSITKSILEGHGCKYGVYNTSSGVCFYFTLQFD